MALGVQGRAVRPLRPAVNGGRGRPIPTVSAPPSGAHLIGCSRCLHSGSACLQFCPVRLLAPYVASAPTVFSLATRIIKREVYMSRADIVAGVLLTAGIAVSCGDPGSPEVGPEEYAFVVTAAEGVTISGEVAAYAIENDELLEVRELIGGAVDGEDLVWEATGMIRSALEGGDLGPPSSDQRNTGGLALDPVTVTVDGRTALVIGMEFTFLVKHGGPGTVTVRGEVNGETVTQDSVTEETGVTRRLVVGEVPGG